MNFTLLQILLKSYADLNKNCKLIGDYNGPRGQVVSTLLRYREVPAIHLGPETFYPEVFCGFPQSHQANVWIVP
jgi:hypothetical protein